MQQQHVITQPMVTPVTVQSVAYQPPPPVQYERKQSMGLGILLIVCGVLAIIFNGVAIGVDKRRLPTEYDYKQTSADIHAAGHGFWGGILFIITGILGVVSASSKTSKCPIIAFMILAIITAVTAISVLSLGIQGAVQNTCNPEWYGFQCYNPKEPYYYRGWCSYIPPCNDKMRTAVAMEAMIAILAFVGGIACIWGSALCCKAVCCCSYTPTYVTAVPYSSPTVTVISQQSGVQQPYAARPQVMTTGVIQPQGPPAYVAGQQYWAPQQQQVAGYGYAPAPYNPQMPVTNMNVAPPSYENPGFAGETKSASQ